MVAVWHTLDGLLTDFAFFGCCFSFLNPCLSVVFFGLLTRRRKPTLLAVRMPTILIDAPAMEVNDFVFFFSAFATDFHNTDYSTVKMSSDFSFVENTSLSASNPHE